VTCQERIRDILLGYVSSMYNDIVVQSRLCKRNRLHCGACAIERVYARCKSCRYDRWPVSGHLEALCASRCSLTRVHACGVCVSCVYVTTLSCQPREERVCMVARAPPSECPNVRGVRVPCPVVGRCSLCACRPPPPHGIMCVTYV
jgi:hypothetical protein